MRSIVSRSCGLSRRRTTFTPTPRTGRESVKAPEVIALVYPSPAIIVLKKTPEEFLAPYCSSLINKANLDS